MYGGGKRGRKSPLGVEDKFRTKSPELDVSVGHTNVSSWTRASGARDTDLCVAGIHMGTGTMEGAATGQQEEVQIADP